MNRFIHIIKQHQLLLSRFASAFLLLSVTLYAGQSIYSDWKFATLPLPHIKTQASQNEQQEVLQKIESLPSQSLFGRSPHASTDPSLIPISSLQIKITGISKALGADSEKHSSVLMSISGQPPKTYRIKDEVASGVTVHDITETAVIFSRSGKLEKILLPRSPLEFKPKPQPRPAP